ncbi:MAG: aspartate ammonia-lyase [Deltaproteobacteria bacterium]|nr:aspartate ammonia-lyase [Deltaproteobacteria bacterium]
MEKDYRKEKDLLGEREVPAESLWGIHTLRALENFPLSRRPVHPELIKAFGTVKLACAQTNGTLGAWNDNPAKGRAIEQACTEMAAGHLNDQIVVDSLQGGAGTSTNMNVNEVLANRALELLGVSKGSYGILSPLDDINLHQSTNDTYPTALKLAAVRLLHSLEEQVVALQEAFQAKEKEFAHVVKVSRTQLQDAVLTTLGREMSAYADALARDRWRIYKCEERLRVVNLGGTAIGTGLGAPRKFIFRVVDALRGLTGIGFARAENLIDNTQNADVFVEVSGILKALAVTLLKSATDIRLMSSGPQAGLGEIRIPELQAGSSIMPGKVNPVIPEAVSQIAILVMAYDQSIAMAASLGNLDLNQFLPLIAFALLDSLTLLTNGCTVYRQLCVEGIEANEAACIRYVEGSTATATALATVIGYEKTSEVVKFSKKNNISIKEAVISQGILDEAGFNELISPEAVTRLGSSTIMREKDDAATINS